MSWARIDDGFHDHPKVDDLSLTAVGLWTLCLTWAHRHRRTAPVPGHITEARVQKTAGKLSKKLAEELVSARLWDVEPDLGGWTIHDFADYLPRDRDPDELRASGRKGGTTRAQRAKQAGSKLLADGKQVASNFQANPQAKSSSRASAPAFPTRPDPTTKETGQLEGERYETLRSVPDTKPRPKCTTHPDGNAPGPCGPCGKVREWDARHETAAKNAEADRAARCPDCHGTGWKEHPTTGLPASRCNHRRSA